MRTYPAMHLYVARMQALFLVQCALVATVADWHNTITQHSRPFGNGK